MVNSRQFFTTDEVAWALGVSARRVRQLAVSRHVGTRTGRDWIFTAGDIETLRSRPRRPRKPLTEQRYNDLVDRWNAMSQADRTKAARRCREKGHAYRETLIGEPDEPVYVCTRCLKYATGKK